MQIFDGTCNLRTWSYKKKKTNRAKELEKEENQRLREEYLQEVEHIAPENMVFIDETGVNTSMDRTHARSPKGERAHGVKPHKRDGNVTIIGALALTGITAAMTIGGAADGAVFLAYIIEVLIPTLRSGQVVVMDNLSVHKVAGIKEAIESVGARIIFLPPYSPDLSPIEEAWSKVKGYLRSKAARIRESLENAIGEALDAVTPENANGWFRHAGYRT